MATPIYIPRVNNNDDEVKLVSLCVAPGEKVAIGQVLAEVETDKAVVEVESTSAGFVLGILAPIEKVVAVGSVLLWLGDQADESVPASIESKESAQSNQPTAKARQLLREHGLEAGQIPVSGERLTADDIEFYLANRGKSVAVPTVNIAPELKPDIPGELHRLRSEERGMLLTVAWHRDVAASGYIELEYDPAPWDDYSRSFADRNKLLLSPMLSLMSWRVVQLAKEFPKLNATIFGDQRYEYDVVNLGFTVQAGDTLYLSVVRDAHLLDELAFVNAMGEVQRRAATHKLGPLEVQGATISLSSMARWKVSRHIPLLPPRTAIMIAHAVSLDGRAVLGASYDHRVLNGFNVVSALRKLSKPDNPA